METLPLKKRLAATNSGFRMALLTAGTLAAADSSVADAVMIRDDVNAVNDEGYTALHGVAFRGTNDVVKLLVAAEPGST